VTGIYQTSETEARLLGSLGGFSSRDGGKSREMEKAASGVLGLFAWQVPTLSE
jgi:hypothetical protein